MSRMKQIEKDEKKSVIDSLLNNKFVPNETFEQYMFKQTRSRPTKKLMFDDQPGFV